MARFVRAARVRNFMSQFLDFAVETAREAGAILRAEFDRPKEISYKGEVDIVTESDRRSEALIVSRIQKRYPGRTRLSRKRAAAAARSGGREILLACGPD